jgi:hypothetical protein
MSSEILCYDLVNAEFQPLFGFPNLKEFDTQTYTKHCRVSCLSYRKDLGDYEANFQSDFSKQIVRLNYKTLREIRNEIKGEQEDVEKLKFRNFINPFSKTMEDIVERIASIAYAGVPAIGVPASFIADSGVGLVISIFIPVAAESCRRIGIHERNSNIKKIKETLKEPRVRIFSDLLEASKINLDHEFVEPASEYMEKIKDPNVLLSVDFKKVNQRLTEIYQNYATQPKT